MQILARSDNEYFQSGFGNAQYFAELEAAYHNSSIVVPLTYNDPGEEKNFVNGTVRSAGFSHLWLYFLYCAFSQGAVDIYGYARVSFVSSCNRADGRSLDSYPQRFDCSHPELWNPVVTNYYEYHEGLMSFLD